MGQRQKRRSEEGEEGTSELENNEYGSVESRERTEKEFLVMEKSRRRAMRKRLPRSKGHSSVLGAIHPWAGGRGKRGGGKVGGEILKKQKSCGETLFLAKWEEVPVKFIFNFLNVIFFASQGTWQPEEHPKGSLNLIDQVEKEKEKRRKRKELKTKNQL